MSLIEVQLVMQYVQFAPLTRQLSTTIYEVRLLREYGERRMMDGATEAFTRSATM